VRGILPGMARGVTQKDIAQRLGVTQKTVSEAFSARGSAQTAVSEELRAKIIATAEAMGYRRHAAAHALATGRFRTIALVLGAEAVVSYVSPHFLIGLNKALAAADHLLVMASVDDQDERLLSRLSAEHAVDGALLNWNVHIPDRLMRQAAGAMPAIWVNRMAATDCVMPDDRKAGREATEVLLQRGHRRIVYLDAVIAHTPDLHFSRNERIEGFRDAMREAGLQPELMTPKLMSAQEVTESVRARLAQPDRPTALLSYAVDGGVHAALAVERCGLQIPRDLSVMIFEEFPIGTGYDFDYMQVPFEAVGVTAAEEVLAKIEAPQRRRKTRRVPFVYVPGQTLAPPPEQRA
jgi:LacI family transcriptional regulator